jgi:hypothetical protein
MRIISVVISSVLVAMSFIGCVPQSEEDRVDDEIAAPPLDGRAAVAAEAARSGGSTLVAGIQASWPSGTVAPGATMHWYWNNASLTAAYAVGLAPVGASHTTSCVFAVTRTWDVQKYGGEREFHFQIKNTGQIECGTYILLRSQQRSSTWGTGEIEVGASKTYYWNNANPLTAAHFVGLSPRGATSIDACELQVTRTWYIQRPTQEREFYFTIKNIGDVACQGDIQLALATNSVDSKWTWRMAPGYSETRFWPLDNPLDQVYVLGVSPMEASGTDICRLEVSPSAYIQYIDANGNPGWEGAMLVKNVGSFDCSGMILFNTLN